MKYRNIITGEVVEPTNFTTSFAYANNSNYELIEEGEVSNDLDICDNNQDDLTQTNIENETDNLTQNSDEELEDNSNTDEDNKETKATEKSSSKRGKKNEKNEIEEGEVSDEIQE